MPRVTIDEADLERELLRKGVSALRDAVHRCTDCGRVPLTGERVHLYARGTRVCELCRPRREEAPERVERVAPGERGGAVRLTARAA